MRPAWPAIQASLAVVAFATGLLSLLINWSLAGFDLNVYGDVRPFFWVLAPAFGMAALALIPRTIDATGRWRWAPVASLVLGGAGMLMWFLSVPPVGA